MSAFGWKLHGNGSLSGPDDVVAPDERLSWGKTIGLGAQHVVAMFGATFVFPLVMGLNPQLAIMMSGLATIIFLLIVQGKVPSYLGTSASFVGAVAAIRAQEGATSARVTGAILVAGVVLALVGVAIHFLGSGVLHRVLPPVVTGAVVMLIGFNLAPVVAGIYWPQDQWVAFLTMLFTIVCAVAFKGFIGRISVFLALIFGTALSWFLDKTAGPITSVLGGATEATEHLRWNTAGIGEASWFGLPAKTTIGQDGTEVAGWHMPSFSMAAILLVLPAVIALVAENTGHVKAVAEMTGKDLDPVTADAFISSIVTAEPPFTLMLDNQPWFAHVTCQVSDTTTQYPIQFWLVREKKGLARRWSILSSDMRQESGAPNPFIHSRNHETGFTDLLKADVLAQYGVAPYVGPPGINNLFGLQEKLLGGVWTIDEVSEVRMHLLQVPGWFVEVEYRPPPTEEGWITSGWNVINLRPMSDVEKTMYIWKDVLGL